MKTNIEKTTQNIVDDNLCSSGTAGGIQIWNFGLGGGKLNKPTGENPALKSGSVLINIFEQPAGGVCAIM